MEIIEMLVVEDPELVNVAEELFRRSRVDYENLRQIVSDKRLCLFMLNNRMEQFYNMIKQGNV